MQYDGHCRQSFHHRIYGFREHICDVRGRQNQHEQIRNTIGYPHLNVKIGATHAGISVGEDGASHQCCEDIALMRTIPGMTIINPTDDVEAKAAVFAAAEVKARIS